MSHKKGFTFIELSFYMAIFTLIIGVLTSVLITYSKISARQGADSEVNNQINFALQTIRQLIASPSTAVTIVNEGGAPQDQDRSPNNVLVLRRQTFSEDPIKIYINNNFSFPSGVIAPALVKKIGAGIENPLTTDKVKVTSLTFTKNTNYPGHDLIKVSLSMEFNANPPNNLARTITSTIGRASAATFDDSVYPGTAGLNLGTAASKWTNGYFSGSIKVDSGIQVTTPATGKPSCSDSSARGIVWVTPGTAGVKDLVEVCAKNAADVFGWRLIY